MTERRAFDGQQFETKLTVGSWQSAEEVMKEIDKDEVFYAESGGGVTFSGGEPLMQPQALRELLQHCKSKGYHTAIDTSGHAEPAALQQLIELADLWLFDLKIMDDARHVEYAGVSNELALKNLQALALARKKVIIRFPFIPGITDAPENMKQIAVLMDKLKLNRIDILPYHSIAKEKYRRMGKTFMLEGLKEPDEKKVNETVEFFVSKGFIVGNGG